jgi:hypothetical protein
MRTLDGCIEQLKRDDPGTCFTRFALRKMVLAGQVPHIRAGTKYLVNYDILLGILCGNAANQIKAPNIIGTDRIEVGK